ncbi:hypothetical protein ACFL2C_01340 [Patescibacteria group bacterium]
MAEIKVILQKTLAEELNLQYKTLGAPGTFSASKLQPELEERLDTARLVIEGLAERFDITLDELPALKDRNNSQIKTSADLRRLTQNLNVHERE